MTLSFRNLDVTPQDPVTEWGVEGLLTAIERGTAPDWKRIIATVSAIPQGGFREDLNEALELAEGGGAFVLNLHLSQVDETSSEKVLRRAQSAYRMANMSMEQYAKKVGTSRSRMSTYLSGKVMPSAQILQTMIDIGEESRREVMTMTL